MLDITEFKTNIRNHLLSDTDITNAVSDRVNFAELFTLLTPVYPCININLFEGRNVNVAVDNLGINVYCSSKISYLETDTLFDLVNDSLHNQYISGIKAWARLQITPINRLIEKPIPIYQNISRYVVTFIK